MIDRARDRPSGTQTDSITEQYKEKDIKIDAHKHIKAEEATMTMQSGNNCGIKGPRLGAENGIEPGKEEERVGWEGRRKEQREGRRKRWWVGSN